MSFTHKHLPRVSLLGSLTILLVVILVLPFIIRNGASFDALVSSDTRITTFLFSLRTPLLLRFFYGITLLGSVEMLLSTVFILSIVLWARHQKPFILTLWLTLIAGGGVMLIAKSFLQRPRPDLWLRAVSETTSSFPSGHATTAVAFFGFLAYLIGRTHRNKRIRNVTMVLAITLILLVDLSRLFLGVHYLSDILAGNLIGLGALLFAAGITEHLIAAKKTDIPTLPVFDIALVLAVELFMISNTVILSTPPWI